MISFRPSAAIGFPFLFHRTVAEVEAAFDEAERLDRENTRVLSGAEKVEHAEMLGMRSVLPPAPCPRCGDRGWCGHGGRVA